MPRNWMQAIPTPEAYQLNRILYDLQHNRAEEAQFLADPKAYITGTAGLTARAADALITNDIAQLYLLGVNPYLLRAYCLQLRVPEEDYLAALRQAGMEIEHG